MFEHILLQKLLNDKEFFSKVIPILKDRYFTSIGNAKIFDLMFKYYSDYQNIPTMTEVIAQVKNIPNQETRRSIVQELQSISKTEIVQNTEFMINETVDFAKNAIFTEALILGSDALVDKSEEKILKSKQLMEEMSKISVNSDLGLDFDDIESMIEYYQKKDIGVRTIHDSINKRIGTGFLPGTLSIILAAAGIGKSLLMTDILSGQLKMGKNILLISMEMQDRELMKRVHANALDLPINGIKEMSPDAIRMVKERFKTNGKLFVKDYPAGSFSPLMLDSLLDSYKNEKGIEFDIVYLDYLGIMKSDLLSPSAGLYSYIKSITEETRAIATKRQIPIVSANQLNRCLDINTVIKTNNSSVRLNNIKVGQKLADKKEVQEVMYNGKQQCYEIKTKSGKTLICSKNHKIPTNKGTMTISVGLKEGLKVHTI